MVSVEFPTDVILLVSFDVELCSVDTWSILVCISWYLLWVLATSSSFSVISTSFVILNVPHLPSCDFPLGFLLWSSCYLEHRLFLPCIPLCLLPMLIYFPSLVLGSPHFSWCCFSWSPLLYCFHPLLVFSLVLQFPLLFFLTIISLLEIKHLCYPLLYLLDPFLIGYLLWYLSSLKYVTM